MAYLALYRAWRPRRFEDVVGQEHITQTLKNALRENRFSHAYLFNGPRGTGKTSTAKILAKAVNCQLGVSEEPCNECNTCKGITDGSILDVVEIDAASNRGVEEIRDLREKVKFAPTETKYKVYIIDEVHMLTTEAFNALLKTLEEPPAHVIFILATTEPHKLPLTIISRCQRFDFRRITPEKVVNRLRKISEAEDIKIDDQALKLIARHSEGGMRDALSLLDQVLSFSNDYIHMEDILKVTGSVANHIFSDIANAIHGNNVVEVLRIATLLIQEGKDPERILEDLLYYFRDLLLFRNTSELEVIDQVFLDEKFLKIAECYTDDYLFKTIEILNEYLKEIKRTNQTQIILELALIKITKIPSLETQIDSNLNKIIDKLQEKINTLEKKIELITEGKSNIEVNRQEKKPIANINISDSNTLKQLNKLREHFNQEEHRKLISVWPNILQMVKDRRVTVHAWLIDGEPVGISDDKLIIGFNNIMHRDTTNKPSNRQLIEEIISEVTGKRYSLYVIMQKDWRAFLEESNQKGIENNNTAGTMNESERNIVKAAIDIFGEDLVEIKD